MNTILWKPLTPENVADPYGMYTALRKNEPVHRAQTGEYIVTRYRDVLHILKSPSFQSGNRLLWLEKGIEYFDHKKEDFRAIAKAMNSFILMLNDAHHRRIRNFISRTWSDREVDALIEKNICVILKKLPQGEFDFVAEYAQPIPALTIASILGVPISDYDRLMRLGAAMAKTLDLYVSFKDLVTMNLAAQEFIAFFREQVNIKSQNPDEGLLSRLIEKNKEEKAGLSEEELISIGIFLFTAGEETTAGLISNALLHLLRHPQELEKLRQSPDLIASSIDEVLRYDSVVQLLGRVTRENVTIDGTDIPEGSAVTLVIGSANRDDDVFEYPDRFIVDRNPNRHLSFGSGVHFCLGDWLGRRQSQLSINAFLARYPHIALPEQELTWYKNIAVRRLNRLTVLTNQ